MAHSQTCDACGASETRRFSPGWGSLHGTDSLGQFIQKDLCPRCSSVMQLALGELRRRFTVPAVVASSVPRPPSRAASSDTASAQDPSDLANLLSEAQGTRPR